MINNVCKYTYSYRAIPADIRQLFFYHVIKKKKKRSCKAAIGYWLLQTYRFIRIDSDELKSKIDLFVLQ